jgi:aryl-alcohol dehydrogenase-like predicted oxidoreductase
MEMGIGAWAWGDTRVWGYGKGYGETDVRAAFDAAIAAGIRCFDTAELYGTGKSESLLGRFIRETGEKPYIATKFAPLPWRIRKRQLLDALRGSLGRLGMEAVDLYQIHWPSPPIRVETWADALADAVEAGLTRAVGVSNYNADQTRRAYDVLAKRGIPLASNQVEYHLLQRRIERDDTMKTCAELGVKVIAYSPLAMGLLTGKYTPDNPPSGWRGFKMRKQVAAAQSVVALLRETGAKHGKTPAQIAINWTICKGTLPIPGAKDARQVEQNAGAMGWRLTVDEMAALDDESARATG